ncbi:hypothetical protein [Actinoplanes sp. NPDC048796]|uniref:hypothetical protein n=1 Tax=Actinoplanes sp. NPDC048796 TaxID=3155640 RepID=UPI0033EDE673
MSTWDRAFHAYGPARDGGEMMEALRRGDESWRPYWFLWSALYCDGHLTPATALGLRYLAETVGTDDFGGPDPTLREAAVWWIRDVARAALTGAEPRRDEPAVNAWLDEYLRHDRSIFDWDDRDAPGQAVLAAARADCRDLLPSCFAPLPALLTPQRPERLRAAAASAAAALVAHPGLRRHRAEIVTYHADEARHGSPLHRASMLLGLGELGGSTRKWLTDPELGVRVCAALAPGLAADEDATEVLRSAALDPAALDAAFGDMRLHQLPLPRRAVETRGGGNVVPGT